MVITTIYEKMNPHQYVPSTYEKTTERFKNKCIRSIFDVIEHDYYRLELCEIIASEYEKSTGNLIFSEYISTDYYKRDFHKLNDRNFITLLEISSAVLYHHICNENMNYEKYQNLENEINHYFKLDDISLKLSNGELIIVDEEKITENAILPCFESLHRNNFTNSDSFLKKAFDDYKNDNNSSAITSATCAFESLINEIMDREKIKSDGKNNNISKKMESLKYAGITPKYMGSEWTNLIDAMHQPFSVRNKENGAAHGNSENIEISDCMARFTINMIAVDIKLICDLYEEYKAR